MTDHPDPARDDALAAALADFHRRKALGEGPKVDDYGKRLGDSHSDFREIVAAEVALDGAMAAPPADPLPRTFDGYTLLREIGRGAAGAVYEALDRRLGRKVAIKILRTGFDTDPSAVERFRREARICAHLRHDHIVPIFEAGEAEGRHFYAMDLVPGESLGALVKAKRAPDTKTLCAGLAGIADALHALYGAGIVHRDVKPSNVLVRPDGRMVLVDFGLARSAESLSLTQTGDALGTPFYMSPEQMLGHQSEVDQRTDVYGLGGTLYEALTGQTPFQTDDVSALLKMVISQRPQSPRAIVPGLPPDCEAIVLKCLEKRKEDRYPTAAALASDLRAFAEGRPVAGRPVPVAIRAAREVREHWIPIAASLAVLGGALLWASMRPATLEIEDPVPLGVLVKIDGKEVGLAPGAFSVAAGTHNVTLSHRLFSEETRPVYLDPGQSKVILDWSLVAKDDWAAPEKEANEAEARNLFEAATRLKLSRRTQSSHHRGPDHAPDVQLVLPRGDVRTEDLGHFAMKVSEDFKGPGEIRFERAGQVLWKTEWTADDPPRMKVWEPIPSELPAKLRAGDVVTWGWFPSATSAGATAGDAAVTASFRVVPSSVTAKLGQFTTRLGRQPWHLVQHLRAEYLRSQGLQTAALLESYAVAKGDPKDHQAWISVLATLEAWGLQGGDFYGDVEGFLDSAPGATPPSLEP